MPPGPTLRVRDLLFLGILAPIAAAALQQQPNVSPEQYQDDVSSNAAAASASAADRQWQDSIANSLQTPHSHSGQRGFRDTDADLNENQRVVRASANHGALATVSSPAELNAASGQPPAQWTSASTAGLTSRQQARSLQDWQVEDLILLATVDGKLHARDRTTGAPRWTLETDSEVVETIRHQQEDPLFVVEPSQDGSIYVLAPGLGLSRLGLTVKQLVEMSPYANDEYPAVAYTAEKKNTLYTVDAATGNILKTFSSAGSIVNDDRSCRRASPLDLEATECEPMGTLTLGRVDYTIGVQDRNTGEPITTLRYFEWGPNNRDNDLRRDYEEAMDRKYVVSRYDGSILSVDLRPNGHYESAAALPKPRYKQKFPTPVVRVFDIVRPVDDLSGNAALVILPQPDTRKKIETDEEIENVWVGCTKSGNWYALSEGKYPTVTDKAPEARYYNPDVYDSRKKSALPISKALYQGVHYMSLSSDSNVAGKHIGGHERLTIDAPDQGQANTSLKPLNVFNQPQSFTWLQVIIALLCVSILSGSGGYAYKMKSSIPWANFKQFKVPENLLPDGPKANIAPNTESTMVREAEPAQETIFPHDNASSPAPHVRFAEQPAKDAVNPPKSQPEGEDEDMKEGAEPKKKKATRGKRAGKKHKEKENALLEAKNARNDALIPRPAEVITVAASESAEVSGPLQINSLVIHTDKMIGQGSCGTVVYEGSFEGRGVAVKRMLSQYYELASQEVSFLQQSDDHPNVVRYFCQQKDNHFLYIAVELCQASLFEVWEAEKAKTEERQRQLRTLKVSMQQDMSRTLQQLAAGLCHLHKLRIIHRDIKPQNILVAYPKKTQPDTNRLVISDFGLGKNLPENVSTLVDPTGNAGTSGWKAPELISQPRETSNNTHSTSNNGSDSGVGGVSGVKRAADIFSLGCLFFWVLTDGVHPFEDENGWQQLRELNIKQDKKKMDALARWSDAYEPMQLISSMLEHQPENRPTAQAVLNHPYFWPAEKRLAFLCDVSDHFEREPRGTYEDWYYGDSAHLRILEDRSIEVIGASLGDAPPNFLAKLDRSFVDTLGKQRKYSGERLLDLLRALRNKKNHYEDMPEHVKKLVGPLAGGYLSYWCDRFTRLLMTCYEVVHEARLQGNDRFRGYFELGNH
ncbi:hypothetical protein DOTSEDRAFT_179926 [Dothistroma septosporum NZE10]|uniref:non-specific serine/threonine protein kinase n=1 Tax=Dothistroma septosporum (strain NZE10 / CBS 128990) TaxID=675120 RepID=M2WKA8_DOTSN|nr:hypothetical protein DOTSEDRAFT_179926 [Dothistroma septosporum NZE10]